MIDRSIVSKRVEEIDRHLGRLEPYADKRLDDFLSDPTTQDVVEYNLFQIVNHLIDIVQHVVVDEDYGFPQTAYEAGQILLDKGVLSENELAVYRKMVGFRNIVGHDYANINKEIVYSILREGPRDIRTLLATLVNRFL